MRARSPRVAWHLAHVACSFAITLGGMLWAKHQPVTFDLVIATLPAAAVATLRAIEAKSTSVKQRASGPAQPGT
jgi:hypothetical protein